MDTRADRIVTGQAQTRRVSEQKTAFGCSRLVDAASNQSWIAGIKSGPSFHSIHPEHFAIINTGDRTTRAINPYRVMRWERSRILSSPSAS